MPSKCGRQKPPCYLSMPQIRVREGERERDRLTSLVHAKEYMHVNHAYSFYRQFHL